MNRSIHPLFALGLYMLLATEARATILNFNIDNVAPAGSPASSGASLITTHAAYGDNVNSLTQTVGSFVYNYGMGNAFTPNTTVAYSIAGTASNTVYYTDGDAAVSPAWKDTNFLIGGAPAAGRLFRYTFVPTAPFGVTINSFDLFRYIGSDPQRVTWTIFQDSIAGPVIASADTGIFNTTIAAPLTITPNMQPYFGTVVLQIDHVLGSGGGFALDNLNFDESLPVPEPSTIALLGLGAIGLAIRTCRRRAAA